MGVKTAGAGPLKIFVHGWATDSSVWEVVTEDIALKEEFTLVDLPGHGGSGRWLEPTLAPALSAITRAAGGGDGRPLIGIGWSLGAEALIEAAARRPDDFSALVLIGGTARFTATDGYPHGQSRALVRRMIQDMKSDPGAALERFYPLNFTESELGTSIARDFLDRYRYPGPVVCTEGEYGRPPGCYPAFNYRDLTGALEALYSTDLRGLLEKVRCPTLVVHGSRDAVCPVGAGEFLAEGIGGAELAVIEGAGHAPFLTERDRFSEAVNAFLERLS